MPVSVSIGGPRNTVTAGAGARGSSPPCLRRQLDLRPGPLAITDPSWLVIVTSRVTTPAPSIASYAGRGHLGVEEGEVAVEGGEAVLHGRVPE